MQAHKRNLNVKFSIDELHRILHCTMQSFLYLSTYKSIKIPSLKWKQNKRTKPKPTPSEHPHLSNQKVIKRHVKEVLILLSASAKLS